MKKFLLTTVAAFIVAMGANAQVKKIEGAVKNMATELNVNANVKMTEKVATSTPAKAQVVKKNTLRRASVNDIAGSYIYESCDFNREFTSSASLKIEAAQGTITLDQLENSPSFTYNVKITGFTDSRAVAYGEYDAESGQILIPVQTIFNYSNNGTDYGRIVFSALVLDNAGDPLIYGYPMTLNLYEDGTVGVDEGDFTEEIASGELTEGCYIGGFYDYMPDYLNTKGYPSTWNSGADLEVFYPNGVQESTECHISNGAWGKWTNTKHAVYVEDLGSEVVVHNFFDLCPISIAIEGNKATIACPVRVEEYDYAEDGAEEPDYIQIWQHDENLEGILNPGAITGTVSEKDGVKSIDFYDVEYKEAWTDEQGEHEAGYYYVLDYTKWFMVHSTWGENGAYWWGEARNVSVSWLSNASGINEAKANTQSTSKTYNLMGQQVNANAKGLIIRDGKKFLNK